MRRARGFTFVELMVVIAIIALLASVVVANLDGISAPTRQRGWARQIGNQILELKEAAMVQNRPLSVEFDRDQGAWRIVDVPSETAVPDENARKEQTYRSDWELPPDGVFTDGPFFASTDAQNSGTAVVTFNGDGEVQPSGFVLYVRRDQQREDDWITIEVAGLTGLVSYHDGKLAAEEIRKPEDF